MAFMDEAVWRGKIYSGGWVGGEPATAPGVGAGARFGGAANLEAFTDTRWLTSSPA